ncbi:hypothetical protein DOY81_005465 [Sarcophaga bullata]|nr:hypothetical protein DOY81_005465 [Sarcophaga bullata]
MKTLTVILSLATLIYGDEYHYDRPEQPFTYEDKPQTTIIKGFNNKEYEVTMSGSRKIFEARLHLTQQPLPARQYLPAYQQHSGNTSPNLRFYGNLQTPFHNNDQNIPVNSQQHTNAVALSPANQAIAYNGNAQYQFNQQQQQYQQQQQLNQQQYQQQQLTNSLLSPQDQYQHYLQQPLNNNNNNNLPNANVLLNELVNNQKYVSQSEASQLDVYPYKQINGNPRPYTRIITRCDNSGKCEPHNAAANGVSGGTDFLHQQVLKQSHAQIELTGDKCQNKFNYQYTGNALVDNVAKAQRGIAIKKGTSLRDRRLIPYTEVVIPQYPHN